MADVSAVMFLQAATVAALIAAATVGLWPRSTNRRNRAVEHWARANLATLSPEISVATEHALRRTYRGIGTWALAAGIALIAITVASIALGGVAVNTFGSGSHELLVWWSVLFSFGLGTTVTLCWQLSRPWFKTGQASPSPKAVSLSDYLPPSIRVSAWITAAACLVTLALLPFILRPGPRLGVQIGGTSAVLVTLLFVEWLGRRMVARPQPADTAQRYTHDMWRANILQICFRSITIWGGLSLAPLGFGDILNHQLGGSFTLVGIGLMLTAVITQLLNLQPAAHARARLWPQLQPGQFVGHPVATP
jgi:hypothetical protein